MSIFVFVGPTLSEQQVLDALPSATVVPPVARGDVLRLVFNHEPGVIAIIDGYFNSRLAVWHKEILFAIKSGFHVFGSASLGALRAAELSAFGMIGVGEIFSRFDQGVWDADDEVAVIHGPRESEFRPGSVALVNIRLALEDAQRKKVVSAQTAMAIVSRAKATFYADRSWERVFADAATDALPTDEIEQLNVYIASVRPDAKRDDALQLLRLLHEQEKSGQAGPAGSPSFDFEPSIFWERLVTEIEGVGTPFSTGTADITQPDLKRHILVQPEGREIQRGAALLYLLLTWERSQGNRNTAEGLEEAARRFRRRRGLLTGEEAQRWCQQQGLTDREFQLLMRLECNLDAVLTRYGSFVHSLLPYELKRKGEFATVRQAITKKQHLLRETGTVSLSLDDVNTTLPQLINWYQENFESIEGSLDSYAQALGFASAPEFLNEILLEYKLRRLGGAST
jgi:hypothetical protein